MLGITVRILGLSLFLLFGTLRVMHSTLGESVRHTVTHSVENAALAKSPTERWETELGSRFILGFESFVATDPPEADIPLAIFGAATFVVSFYLPKRRRSGELVFVNGEAMMIPSNWDEDQISLDIERYRGNQGMLKTYLGGIADRFIAGQNQQTIEARTRFLERWNKFAEVSRQSYRWRRYIEGGRAKTEEDIADLEMEARHKKAQGALDEVDSGARLRQLQQQSQELDLEVAIAEKKRQLEQLNNPPPPPPPPRAALDELAPEERKAAEREQLNASEKNVREAMERVKADTTLSEEQRRRNLNNLEERLDEIHERQVALL